MAIKGIKRIKAGGTITEWKVGREKRDIKIAGLLFSGDDMAALGDWIGESESVVLTLAAADSQLALPPVKGAGKLVGLDIRPQDHRPKFKDLVFTELDPVSLTAMIAAETDVVLTLMLVQNRLVVTDDEPGDEAPQG